jgi:hypothetical protein
MTSNILLSERVVSSCQGLHLQFVSTLEFLYVGTWYTSREHWTRPYVGSFDPAWEFGIKCGISAHINGSSICLHDRYDPRSVCQYYVLDSLSVLTLATSIQRFAPFSNNC